MVVVTGVGPLVPPRAAPRRPAAPGFHLPEDPAAEAVACTAVAMPSLLALQEAEQGLVQDREARRHGDAVLDALAALQRALLGGADPGATARLATLVRKTPAPADPALASVQRALLVRVAVELARGASARRS